MFKFRYSLLSVLTVAMVGQGAWAAYKTSFEPADGFTAGTMVNNTDGWSKIDSSASRILVTTSQHSDGGQSIEIPKPSQNIQIARTFTSAEAPSADPALSFDFYPTETAANAPVAWAYVFGKDDVNSAASGGYIQFRFYNAPSGAGAHPYMQWQPYGGTAANISLPSGAWTSSQWNSLKVVLDATDQSLDFFLNNQEIASDLSIKVTSPTSSATHISGVTIANYGFGGYYVDNVRISAVPEPASLGLLAFGGLLMLRRRKSV